MEFLSLLFWLVVFHFLADYPLQGEFLARLKNPHDSLHKDLPFGIGAWRWGLFGHSFIHGGFVFYATGNLWLGLGEVVAHSVIDLRKCEKQLTFNQDQWLHIAFKVLWAAIAVLTAQ